MAPDGTLVPSSTLTHVICWARGLTTFLFLFFLSVAAEVTIHTKGTHLLVVFKKQKGRRPSVERKRERRNHNMNGCLKKIKAFHVLSRKRSCCDLFVSHVSCLMPIQEYTIWMAQSATW